MNRIKFMTIWGLLAIGASLLIFHKRQDDVVVVLHEGQDKNTTITMPYRDAVRLEVFFRELIMKDGLGYTLVGKKPMSFGVCRNKFPLDKMTVGWDTWQKYAHLCQNPRFGFWAEQAAWSKGIKALVLVDKQEAAQVIEQNRSDFQEVLQIPDVHLDLLLRAAQEQPLIQQVLHNHDALLGILLGYGRDNAWWYHARDKTQNNPSVWEQTLQPTGFIEYLRRHWSRAQMDDMFLPGFVGMAASAESMALKKHYLAARQDLIRYYEGKNFLEATLNLYKNGPSEIQKSEL